MKSVTQNVRTRALALAMTLVGGSALASSHMDAPLITLDDAANTTDVYAFVTDKDGTEYLTTALAVYPFEEPGIGPNKYNFDDDVLYEIHVALGKDLEKGRPTFSYQFQFETNYKDQNTILQSYRNVINEVDDAGQNLTQTYRVTRVSRSGYGKGKKTRLQFLDQVLKVPPNNQGIATPRYNISNDGENPARPGVDSEAALDDYTRQTIYDLKDGYRVFAGQRDDGFYADIQGVFDLLQLESPLLGLDSPNKPFDSQGGYNLHTIVLQIPIEELGGADQIAGVYATTSRRQVRVLKSGRDKNVGRWVQVGRQGNPLFNEGFVAIVDKDRYSRTPPTKDRDLFIQYALEPELARLLNGIHGTSALTANRTDIAGIFIPDLIKVDLSTGPAALAGDPDDADFHRLGVFGGDLLTSTIQDGLGGGAIPGGWPNGRRFGDDVLDIAVCAAISDLRDPANLSIGCSANDDVDAVKANDITYNKVMPYAATPLNGRSHSHH